jgi:hypothetical protein
MVTVYFNFDKEESPKALRTPAFGDSFVWLGWRDSDPRVMESKSKNFKVNRFQPL